MRAAAAAAALGDASDICFTLMIPILQLTS